MDEQKDKSIEKKDGVVNALTKDSGPSLVEESIELLVKNENKTANDSSVSLSESIEVKRFDDTKEPQNFEDEIPAYGLGYRHLQMILVFWTAAFAYIMRSNVSVAIVSMTDKNSNLTNVQIFDWDMETKGVVLSSFLWGYIILQVPSGQLAERFGPKILFVLALFINGAVSIFFPNLVYLGGWKAACFCRALQGISQSCLQPCSSVMLSKWAHVNERSRLGTLTFVGCQFGTVLGMTVVGYLCDNFGWPSSFRVIGVFTVVMGLIYIYFGCDKPSLHSKISDEERKYIESSLGSEEKKVLKTPWMSIFASLPFWAIVVAHFGINWGYVTILFQLPTYLKEVLRINVKTAAVLSALPYLFMACSSLMLSYFSDLLIKKEKFSINVVRKTCTAIASLGLGLGVVLMTFIPSEKLMLQAIILVTAMAFMGGSGCGFMLGYVDMSPNFAGTLMGISNCIANGLGILAPMSAGFIIKDANDQTQWRIVFILIFIIMNGSALFYATFGTSIAQKWNDPPNKEDEKDDSTA